MTVDALSEKIAISINKNNPGSSSVPVLKIGISALINQIIITACVMILGLITGKITETIIAVVAFPFLRYFSGGFHFKSSTHCNIVTSSFILLSIYIPIGYWYNGLIFNIASIVLLAINAPSGIKRSRLDKKYFPILKLLAVVIVAANFFIQSPVLSLVFFIQSLTTPRIFQKILEENKL